VVPLSLGLALLLDARIPLKGAARTVVILPWVVSQTVVALLWAWLLNADFGPVPWAVQGLTGQRPAALASPVGARVALVIVNVWASYPQATLLLRRREFWCARPLRGGADRRRVSLASFPLRDVATDPPGAAGGADPADAALLQHGDAHLHADRRPAGRDRDTVGHAC
jgi:hypothetical protein